MQMQTMFSGKAPFQMKLGFEDFLYSGLVRRQSMVAMCEPEDLIMDHLPSFDWGDDEEISEAFAEACEEAVEYQIDKVHMDNNDLEFIRRHFARPDRLRLVQNEMLHAV